MLNLDQVCILTLLLTSYMPISKPLGETLFHLKNMRLRLAVSTCRTGCAEYTGDGAMQFSTSIPTLGPESPSRLCAEMREFSSCQRHFKQRASEKGTEGDIMPSRNSPQQLNTLSTHLKSEHKSGTRIAHSTVTILVDSQGCTAFLEEPRIALQARWPAMKPAFYVQWTSLELCSSGVFLTVLWFRGSLSVSWHNSSWDIFQDGYVLFSLRFRRRVTELQTEVLLPVISPLTISYFLLF